MMRAAPAAALALILAQPACASDQPPTADTQHGKVRIVTVAEGLEHPWGVSFLPDGRALVTERPGRLRIVGADGKVVVHESAERLLRTRQAIALAQTASYRTVVDLYKALAWRTPAG